MMNKAVRTLTGATALLTSAALYGQGNPNVRFSPTAGAFPIAARGQVASIWVDRADAPAVIRAAHDLRSDIERVATRKPTLGSSRNVILVGTLGHSTQIDALAKSGKLDVSAIRGKWEACVTQVIHHPSPGIDSALVIAGADRRGTVYGIYDLSRAMGVSPWYWWADVPVQRHSQVFVTGRYVAKSPAVKYRGIFINDEEPGLGNWAREKFGGVNSKMYAHVFELLLRLRANYLWPAMWGKAFAQDDPLNPQVADDYGIVMGTSHVEPMMRADVEWNRLGYGEREWNYEKYPSELEKFWREGAVRQGKYENLVTMAMRGKIDTPMTETANIALLEKIVAAQRRILAETVNPDVTKIPQLWCLYKEVQEYYEKGMRVPDDITLLWADDNWGNIRRLPTPDERSRAGGAGVYYHFDYVGGPRNYKWLDTNPIPKIWEQMNLAHRYGANQVWIVNVGDLKPMEFPMEFFLTMAQDPAAIDKKDLARYTERWVAANFGKRHARGIAEVMTETKRLNGRRKPEQIDPRTWSLDNYREAERVLDDYRKLLARAEEIEAKLPSEAHDAYYQLVLHPLAAMANLNELHIWTARNQRWAAEGRVAANDAAEKVHQCFARDKDLARRYHQIGGGKWNHFMDQTHISYTYWQQPDVDVLPELKSVAPQTGFGVTPRTGLSFDRYGESTRVLEVFRRGDAAVKVHVSANQPWIQVTPLPSEVEGDARYAVEVDWKRVPADERSATITVTDDKESVVIPIQVTPRPAVGKGFVEGDGVIAIEAEHTTRRLSAMGVAWELIPDYGRTLSALSPYPVEFPSFPAGHGPGLEYAIHTFSTGEAKLELALSPTLAFQPGRANRIAVAFDEETPQVVEVSPNYLSPAWERAVSNSVHRVVTRHLLKPGPHRLRIWAMDPGVVLERIVIDLGGLRPSYLGPQESHRNR